MYFNKEPRGSKIAHENKTGKKRFKTPGYARELCSVTLAGLADIVTVQTVYTTHDASWGRSEFCSRGDSNLKDKTKLSPSRELHARSDSLLSRSSWHLRFPPMSQSKHLTGNDQPEITFHTAVLLC